MGRISTDAISKGQLSAVSILLPEEARSFATLEGIRTMGLLPWWLDFTTVPVGHPGAQPLWVHGQWQFIAFTAQGIPLRRLCRDVAQADRDVADYNRAITKLESTKENGEIARGQDMETSFQNTSDRHSESYLMSYATINDNLVPAGYSIFSINEMSEDTGFVVLRLDGTLLRTTYHAYTAACDAALEDQASPPRP